MADNQVVHPKADYKIQQVGPTRDWDFNTDNGKIAMRTYSVQFEGIADWCDLSQKADGDAPKVGDTVTGEIQDAGKYGFKFVKEKKQGNWSGGGRGGYNAGAAWANAYETAAAVLASYFSISENKPKTIKEYLAKLDNLAPTLKKMVDDRAGTAQAKQDADDKKSESESGESPTPAKKDDVVIDDIGDDELGAW